MSKDIRELVRIAGDNHLETLKQCGGYYICPKLLNGKRLGPLVGYAGKYKTDDGQEKAWVGEVYYNFAKAEKYPHVLDHFVTCFIKDNRGALGKLDIDVVLGAPMGGILFAGALARALNRQCGFFEKKVVATASENKREESILVLDRHAIEQGQNVVLVEDVCNNFSTTDKAIELVEKSGGKVIAIVCEMNRSATTEYKGLPVLSLLYVPTAQYKQEDPFVKADIEAGNVVWKPKDQWSRLAEAMAQASR